MNWQDVRTPIVIVGLLSVSGLFAQTLTPEFLTTIYFEDAIGNRDSVKYGYDERVTDDFAPQFGEEHISAPFDSVFEVRVLRARSFLAFEEFQRYTGKIVVGRSLNTNSNIDCNDFNDPAVFLIRAIHQPVKITWVKEEWLGSECRAASLIMGHFWEFQYGRPFWWLEPNTDWVERSACMVSDSSLSLNLETSVDSGEAGVYDAYEEVEGVGIDTLYAIQLVAIYEGHPGSHCMGTTDVFDFSRKRNSVSLHPNPATDLATFSDAKPHEYWLLDATGRLISHGEGISISLSHLASGSYYLHTLEGSITITKE